MSTKTHGQKSKHMYMKFTKIPFHQSQLVLTSLNDIAVLEKNKRDITQSSLKKLQKVAH